MLIADCASDPPLGRTARALATLRADDVVYGLGALALAGGHRKLAVAVADAEARAALQQAIARVEAKVALVDAPAAWPAVTAAARDVVVPAAALVALADEARGRAPAAYVTVAGAVATPAVVQAPTGATMAELVARAGGPLDDDWVPLAGGAPAGALVERAATWAQAGAPSLVLALPAGHAAVRRLRTSVGDWLWRAASACEGCRACSDACAVTLLPHALVATLATGRDDGTAAAAMAACSGCGVCDAACPAGLSPRALAVATRDRLRAGGIVAPAAARPGLDRALLTLRLGLADYDREPQLMLG